MKNKVFYVQILLGLFTIMLSLAYEIVRIVHDRMLIDKSNGFVYWMGIKMHISFWLDSVLYILLLIESILIILIIEEKIKEK